MSRRILLLGWEGADWAVIEPLLDAGLLPNLARLLGHGVRSGLKSIAPTSSHVDWTSALTGTCPEQHDVWTEFEPDGAGNVQPSGTRSRKRPAIWNILNGHDLRSIVVNWPATHPAETIAGAMVSDRYPITVGHRATVWPMGPNDIHPVELYEPLMKLRVHPAQISSQQIRAFVPGPRDPDPTNDPHEATIAKLLAECASTHNAATFLSEQMQWDLVAVRYETIEQFSLAFMRYHPPKLSDIEQEAFARLNGVVRQCYQFHDMMLGRWMELTGDQTTIVIASDHGFQTGLSRPIHLRATKHEMIRQTRVEDPLAWHTDRGIFCAAGPGIVGSGAIDDIDIVQIVLRILELFDLPPTEVSESVVRSSDPDPWERARLEENLIGVGALEPRSVGSELGIEQAICQRLFHRAQRCHAQGDFAQALELLERVLDYRVTPAAELQACQCLIELKRYDTARQRLEDEMALHPHLPHARLMLAHLFLRLHDWTQAEKLFREHLSADPDSAGAWDGIGMAQRHTGRMKESIESHRKSVALNPRRGAGHFHLGMALAAMNDVQGAIESLLVAIALDPRDWRPHHRLAELYMLTAADPGKAHFHRQQALTLRAGAQAKGDAS